MTNVFRNLDWSILISAVLSVIPALICITVHETAHGFVAWKLGDSTAKDMGRLTLNPLKHVDLFGLIMMAVFHFGWAKPVPVNMYRFKNPKRGMAITAAAGPASNILLALVFFALYIALFDLLRPTEAGKTVLEMLYITGYISVALAIFNVIPIPPLDGSKVLFSLLPDKNYYSVLKYERYGMIVLAALILLSSYTGIFGNPLGTAASFVSSRLLRLVSYLF